MPYTAMDKYKNKPWPEGDKRYATMISTIDAHMGRLNDLVDSLGIAENTLLIFLSDNGGGNGQRIFYHYVQFFKSNGNFRGMKRDLYEGGIRVPMIAQWKGVIPATSVSDEPVAYYDLMKTFADLANVELPKTDGASLVPLFTTEKDSIDRPYLYWEFPYMDIPNAKFAVRKGKWKGVKEYKNQPLQLYNIDEDPSEVFNLAKEYPEIITEMEAIIAKEHEPSTYWPMYDE
jgi:arylsulfatase A-like enzyme